MNRFLLFCFVFLELQLEVVDIIYGWCRTSIDQYFSLKEKLWKVVQSIFIYGVHFIYQLISFKEFISEIII